MSRLFIIAVAFAASPRVVAADDAPPIEVRQLQDVVTRFIDLRSPQALAELRQSNPGHYEKIRQILTGLQEQPERAEGDWLQTNFQAHDVNLARFVIKASNPPKQLLEFTLDDVRYTMHVVRRDMAPLVVPAR